MGVQSIRSSIGTHCRIGVVADTHGWIHPEVMDALRGVDLVVHAGDIGDPEILEQLRTIAPVRAVRGNMDSGAWAEGLPDKVELDAGGMRILMIHDADEVRRDPERSRYAAVIAGHSHLALQETLSGTLYFNPGTAGAAKPGRPVSVGVLEVDGDRLQGEILLLEA